MAATAAPTRHLFIESDMDLPAAISFPAAISLPRGQVTAICRRCPDKEEPNDDCAAVIPTAGGGVVLVVADGVGGCPLGHKASAIAVESIADSVERAAAEADLRPAILDGIELANRDILDLGIGAATTLSVVEIRDGKMRAYQVGDSMTLLVGGRGALKWKSMAHSPVGYAVESGMLDEADAMHHHERHIVSNLVGSQTMHIEIGPVRTLSPRDRVIVASDGLCDNLHVDEIIALGHSGNPCERVAALASLATERMNHERTGCPGKPDDLTLLLFAQQSLR